MSSTNPSIRPLTFSGDVGISYDQVRMIQDNVKRDLFAVETNPTDPTKTATELLINYEEVLGTMGASFARLQNEFCANIFEKGLAILTTRGDIEPYQIKGNKSVFRLGDRNLNLKYTSPLAKVQDMEDLENINNYLSYASTLGLETMAYGVKIEKMPTLIAKKLGIPSEMIRTEDEQKELTDSVMAGLKQQQPQQ